MTKKPRAPDATVFGPITLSHLAWHRRGEGGSLAGNIKFSNPWRFPRGRIEMDRERKDRITLAVSDRAAFAQPTKKTSC